MIPQVGDLIRYDKKICLLTEIRNYGKDHCEFILLFNGAFYNLNKYQFKTMTVIK